jgi:poly(U)-binding-splicing factor PUF60
MTQALSLMARLYVGSVSFEVKEDNIRQMFSVFGPLKSLNMSYDTATGVSFLPPTKRVIV